ncbi:hypothetical protein [Bradyrhizobium sp. CCBAU 51753]|uniref:hypothetical protein n=1 Tax=Bradyrhizobium sp. CCBAU 51753 TaxID=1325100 RepID=UPI00188C5FC4|nr:hypothetical protein [Bradyrhizobium sp. CCBAU 51753]QOZ26096.1 hypothetical protein XH93_22730 [Bradyrhizobium sp. CCBAU 51753]
MFIRLGSLFVNSQYVAEIRLRSNQANEPNATLVMHDGSQREGFVLQSEIESLTETIVPAPAGFEANREYELDFDDDGPVTLDWRPVVAFAVHSGGAGLDPITADDGRLEKYALRSPDGKVRTSSDEFFDSSDEYRAFLQKMKGKAA